MQWKSLLDHMQDYDNFLSWETKQNKTKQNKTSYFKNTYVVRTSIEWTNPSVVIPEHNF